MTCDQLRQIKVPALMTYGADTRPAYRIAAEGAAGCIPGAQLVAIRGGRHLAIVQQPDAFNAALLQFLAKGGFTAETLIGLLPQISCRPCGNPSAP